MKRFLFVFIVLLYSVNLIAQEYALDKGAVIVKGDISFSSLGGDFFEDSDGNSLTNFKMSPGFQYFIIPNFSIGASISANFQGQGDVSSTGIGIGPTLAYFFGTSESTVYPYLGVGVFYLSRKTDFGSTDITFNGTNIGIGGGLLFPIRDHLGLAVGLSYEFTNLKETESNLSFSGNAFALTVGLSGLLFWNCSLHYVSKVCVEIAVFLPLTTAPVKLLPLVKMMPSPKHEENTCYFYNRVDPKGFRLISYHYDKEPEIITGGDDIKSALEIFKVTE